MKGYKGPNTGMEFLRAAWQEIKTVEEDHRVMVEIEWHRDPQLGVFCLHLTARGPIVDVGLLSMVASLKGTYPSARNASLEAFMFQQVIKLGQMCGEFRAIEAERTKMKRG